MLTPPAPSSFVARPWPDAADGAGILLFLAIAVGLPAAGYVCMVLDIRRYLRSLRRALVVVAHAAVGRTPDWALDDRPPCLAALGLNHGCTEDEVLAAYRQRVKNLHPDHGGELPQFLRLQKHFEQALHLARSRRGRAVANSGV